MQKAVRELKEIGFRFALDDYGTGRANSAILDNMRYISLNSVQSWKAWKQRDTMIQAGVNYLQGYYCSRPVPGEQFMDYLRGFIFQAD